MPEAALAQLRAQFPALQLKVADTPLVYLDNAATSQKPHCVIDAVVNHWQRHNANVHRASHRLSRFATEAFEEARQTVARFIHAPSAAQIVWTRGTTESINLLANVFTNLLKPGDEILLTAMEHHANIVPWQLLCERTGAVLNVVPVLGDGRLDMAQFAALLSSRTKVFAVGHASNALGTIHPVQQMVAAAKNVGAITVVDGAQAVAHLAVDVQALDCDFYAFSGHKMFAPSGIGVLYGKAAALAALPPWQGGGEMIEKVSFSGSRFQAPPFRFEAGTPNIEGAIGLAAAIDFINAQPRQQWLAHEQALRQHTYQRLAALPGVTLYGPPADANDVVSLVSITIDGVHGKDMGMLLDQQQVAVRVGHHCAMPLMEQLGINGTLRISFAAYNSLAEADRVVDLIAGFLVDALADTSAENSADNLVDDSAEKLTENTDQLAMAAASHSSPPGEPETVAAVIDDKALPLWVWPLAELQALITTAKGWEGRNRQLMLMAKKLPGLKPEQKQPAAEVTGCESRTWLLHQVKDGCHWFAADSDARIVRGLLVLLLAAVNGQTTAVVQAFDGRQWLRDLGLLEHLSPSRGNGLLAIVDAIQHAVSDPNHRP
ncbi:SufS family cysteine desulfurase [Corallincola holothuriorum]|uniref:cysteine desulfurase n=1 Tax=Corallincola holothuriorum TaxID=2282215 RepID=A0A368N1U7_9GAMM|nr:SufS family cysteine desulfurase [Corallincola holothuriorum]RCU43229.1 SufS family cysteine desulfurase [Corallincola holothuriorum]